MKNIFHSNRRLFHLSLYYCRYKWFGNWSSTSKTTKYFDVDNVRWYRNYEKYFSCTSGSGILKIRVFSISYRKTNRTFPLSKLLLKKIKYHSKNMRNVFCKLGRYFWIPSTYVFDVYNGRKSPNYKTYFHVQMEVGFWKFGSFSISPHSCRDTTCNFHLSKLLPKHQILF